MGIFISLHNNQISWQKRAISDRNVTIISTGYVFVENEYYEKDGFIDLLEKQVTLDTENDSFEIVKNFIPQLNGAWAFIILQDDNYAFLAVDRSRAYPLFFAEYSDGIIISDHPDSIRNHIGCVKINETSAVEFLLSGYVSGRETIYTKINKIQPGEYIEFDCRNNQTKCFPSEYYTFFPEYISKQPRKELKSELADIINSVFLRYSRALEDRNIVVPLSGGFDSRIICLMMRKYGHEKIFSYTYGEKENPQNKIAEKLSKELDIPWHFVEYNPAVWSQAMQCKEMEQYWQHSCRGTSSPHIQDFPALLSFSHEMRLNNPVFLTGHVGDAWASEFVLESFQSKALHPPNEYHSPYRKLTDSDVVNAIVYRHHNLWPVPEKLWEKEAFVALLDKLISGTESFFSPREDSMWRYIEWILRSRTALWIVNSCRSFEMFNSGFMLPLADNELIDFFRKLPKEFLIYRNLYQKCLCDEFFLTDDSPVRGVPLHSGVSTGLDWKRILVDISVRTGVYKKIEKLRKPYRKAKGLAADSWFTRGRRPEQVTVGEVLKPYGIEDSLPKSIMEIIRPQMHKPAYTIQCNGLLAAIILSKIYSQNNATN